MIKQMNVEEIYNHLKSEPESLFLPDCDDALIGIVEVSRDGGELDVACYDFDKLVEHFTREFSVDNEPHNDPYEMALEWVDYNIVGAYHGCHTPVIAYINEEGVYEW